MFVGVLSFHDVVVVGVGVVGVGDEIAFVVDFVLLGFEIGVVEGGDVDELVDVVFFVAGTAGIVGHGEE